MEEDKNPQLAEVKKGRVHIPTKIKEERDINDGDQFLIYTDGKKLILKRIEGNKLRRLIDEE